MCTISACKTVRYTSYPTVNFLRKIRYTVYVHHLLKPNRHWELDICWSTTLSAALTAWLPHRPTRPPCSSRPMGIPNKGQYLNCVSEAFTAVELRMLFCWDVAQSHRVIGAWYFGTSTMSQSQIIWHQLPNVKVPHPWRTYIKSYLLDLKVYNVVIYRHMHSTHGIM